MAENEIALAIADEHPISLGHCLLVPRQHVSSIFNLPPDDYVGCLQLVRTLRDLLADRHSPAGFNLAVNDGQAAGQTVEHAHIHVVPRYEGDLLSPPGLREMLPGPHST